MEQFDEYLKLTFTFFDHIFNTKRMQIFDWCSQSIDEILWKLYWKAFIENVIFESKSFLWAKLHAHDISCMLDKTSSWQESTRALLFYYSTWNHSGCLNSSCRWAITVEDIWQQRSSPSKMWRKWFISDAPDLSVAKIRRNNDTVNKWVHGWECVIVYLERGWSDMEGSAPNGYSWNDGHVICHTDIMIFVCFCNTTRIWNYWIKFQVQTYID